MSTERCDADNCVRVLGHAGCHTAAPSARTLDWDRYHASLEVEIERNASLLMLDFPTPHWADLND